MNTRKILRFLPRLIVAVILFQTLFFKFTASDESVYIFDMLGMEPWGRIGSGIAELASVILLMTPRYYIYGAILSLGVICGALISHLTVLGIEVQNDGGLLFILACVVFICSVLILIMDWSKVKDVPVLKQILGSPGS